MYLSSICSCKFKFNDTIILSSKEPCLYSIKIETKKDLNSRIIKSSSCTIEIPELGIIVEPGSQSQSYITNIEGLLKKIEGIITYITNIEKDNKEKYTKGLYLKKKIENIINNPKLENESITVTLKDPFGNSKIINQKVKYSQLKKEEINNLKTGFFILDKNN